MPETTLLYAGLLGIMSIAVAFPAGALRGKHNISIGDGGRQDLLLAIRRHGNFAEFVPLALILIGGLEMSGVSGTPIHVLGGGLVLARIAHAIGIKADTIQSPLRGVGAGGTALITVVASVWGIVRYF